MQDYASPETKLLGEKIIKGQLPLIPKDKVRQITAERLEQIVQGQRDFRF